MIRVIGISHRLTPLHRREKAAVAPAQAAAALERARHLLGADECVILSTCNRTEVYFTPAGRGDPRGAALELLVPDERARRAISPDEVYCRGGRDAALHLCEVAAGLDSLILGEHEIMAQVKSALEAARQEGCAGPLLTRLFHHALRAGKRARAETRIASGVFSVGHCAARAAQGVLGDLGGKSLLVIGAGRIAEATARHLAHLGANPVTVANRTLERAREVARRLGGRAESIGNLARLVAQADLIITCTSAPHFILEAEGVRRAAAQRGGRPLVIIDVSVPRDVEPAAGAAPGVHLFNLDDLEPMVAENARAREGEVAAVRGIIAQEVQAFEDWRARREVAPVIRDLRDRAQTVRRQCLEQLRSRLGHLPPQDLEAVERLTDLLVKRLLHGPTTALRAHPNGEAFTLAAAVQELFDLARQPAPPQATRDACESATREYTDSSAGGRGHVNLET